jgi:hypothetical protein
MARWRIEAGRRSAKREGGLPAQASPWMSAEALLSAGKVVSLRMQVSRTTRKVGPGAPQRPCASVGFDERNRIAFGHGPAAVLAVRAF